MLASSVSRLRRFVQFLLTNANRSLHLERENLDLEVNFLKAQINPHFLSNTLNNLYTMVVKQDEHAPAIVSTLSTSCTTRCTNPTLPWRPSSRKLSF